MKTNRKLWIAFIALAAILMVGQAVYAANQNGKMSGKMDHENMMSSMNSEKMNQMMTNARTPEAKQMMDECSKMIEKVNS